MIALTFSFLLFSLSSDTWGLFHSYHQPSASGYMNLPKTEKRSQPTCWTVAFWTKGYSVSQQASLKDNQGLVTVWFGLFGHVLFKCQSKPDKQKTSKAKADGSKWDLVQKWPVQADSLGSQLVQSKAGNTLCRYSIFNETTEAQKT